MNTSGLRRVLVIDDDPALLTAITRGLDLIGGFDVRTAKDGASGLDQFFSTHPDCVVVDVRMPGLNGYQFVRALRGDRETAETPLSSLARWCRIVNNWRACLPARTLISLNPSKSSTLSMRLIALSTSLRRSAQRIPANCSANRGREQPHGNTT